MKYISPDFFSQKTLAIAEDLVGCYLCRKIGKETVRLKITETEAYVGPHDLACHASKGRTSRTVVLYEKPGTIYVYLVYGMHYMLNIVTEPVGYPAAILIRGAGEYNGPGKLTKALNIDKGLNNKLAIPKNGLWFEERKKPPEILKIKKTKRIGVEYAGPIWSEKKYRFILQ